MIKCNICNVEILSPGKTCPLCHAPLDIPENEDGRNKCFPDRGFVRATYMYRLDKYFLPIAFILDLIFILWEGFSTNWNIKIAWIPMAVFLDIFYWLRIRHYIHKYFSTQILTHMVGLCLIAFSTHYLLNDPRIIYEYMFPSIIILAYIGMAIYVLINTRSPKKYIVAVLILGIVAIVPLFLSFMYGANFYVLSALTATMGALTVAAVLIFGLARVVWEIKKIFHI
jgi:hypothetical protein